MHLCSNIRNILLTVFKFGTKFPFFSSLEKYISKDNPITLTPVMLGEWGSPNTLVLQLKGVLNPLFSFNMKAHGYGNVNLTYYSIFKLIWFNI